MSVIISARDAQDLVNGAIAGDTYSQLVAAMYEAMITAVAADGQSCTLSVSGKANKDVQKLFKDLREAGYGVTISGTTVTIKFVAPTPTVINGYYGTLSTY